MHIMWHSNAPWTTTGYGTQTAVWLPKLSSLGHKVTVSAFYGLHGSPMRWNDGIVIMPGWNHLYGDDILAERVKNEEADLLITLMDIWVLTPSKLRDLNVAHWMPVDTEPLGMMDRTCLSISEATPIAISRHGEAMLQDCGFDPLYVPHGIDTTVFRPSGDRDALREANSLNDRFIIGINSANKDPFRKGLFEQFSAFAKLYHKHDDAFMIFHGLAQDDNGIDLMALARHLGVAQAIKFADDYQYKTGRMTPGHITNWYAMLDLYSMCSLGEGFGITAVEAMACGIPVVVTDGSAMPELIGKAGWKVPGEKFWNPRHEACWVKPDINGIYHTYEEAYQKGKEYTSRKNAAVAQGQKYSVDTVFSDYWTPALKQLEEKVR
jgi:D-inositol-3-phosphate glycosyltransferase